MVEQFARGTLARLLDLVLATGSIASDRATPVWWNEAWQALLENDEILGGWWFQHRLYHDSTPDPSQSGQQEYAGESKKADLAHSPVVIPIWLSAIAGLSSHDEGSASRFNDSLSFAAIDTSPSAPGPDQLTRQQVANVASQVIRLKTLESAYSTNLESQCREIAYDMAYGLSHELNNPLANIAARARMLAEGESDARTRQLLCAMVDQAMRGGEMLGDLMLFARPPIIETVDHSFFPWLEEVLLAASPWAESRGKQLGWLPSEFKPVGLHAKIAPVACKEALWAILRNAIEWSSHAIRVHIHHHQLPESQPDPACAISFGAREHKSTLTISITDDGPGLTREGLERAFHPYYSGREAGRGLGLGLAKAKRIVEQVGGAIHLENNPQGGCTTCITFRCSEMS